MYSGADAKRLPRYTSMIMEHKKEMVIRAAGVWLCATVGLSVAALAYGASPEDNSEEQPASVIASSSAGANIIDPSDVGDTDPPYVGGSSTPPKDPLIERVERATPNPSTRNNAVRGELKVTAQTRITNLAANLSNKMEGVISRLQNITARLESRMAKLEQNGTDTTNARASLAEAKASLTIASNLLANIDQDVYAFVTSDKPAANWLNLRETFSATREAILAARGHLRSTVAELKIAVQTESNPSVNEAVQADQSTATTSSSTINQ